MSGARATHPDVGIEESFMKNIIQFVAALVAAMLGEYIVCWLLRVPSMSQPRFWVAVVFWSVAELAYLAPRSATRSLRTRILACFLFIAVLAVARAWLAWHLRIPVHFSHILAPMPALVVFCIAAFLTAPPRAPSRLVAVLLVAVVVQFLSMWWSYGFETEQHLGLAALQVIPLLSATAALLLTDNLIKTEENPTTGCSPISNRANAV